MSATAERFEVVIGMPAWLTALAAAGMTAEENRAVLVGKPLTRLNTADNNLEYYARDRRPMRCTKYAFGGSGETLNPCSQALQKMFRLIPTRGLRSKP